MEQVYTDIKTTLIEIGYWIYKEINHNGRYLLLTWKRPWLIVNTWYK